MPGDQTDDLNIKSEDLRRYFQRHSIVPHRHPKYKTYFSTGRPEIALTYEWKSSFRDLRACLSPDNIRRHNRTALDPNPSWWDRLYLMSFLWVFLGPLHLIPEDIDERTVFIDIMVNNHSSRDIQMELTAAEREYEDARLHLVVATSGVLERAWCLFEIAVRRCTGGRSQLLVMEDQQEKGLGQLKMSMVGPLTMLKMILGHALLVFSGPHLLGGSFLKLIWGIDVSRLDSASATILAADDAHKQFFSGMKASVHEDRVRIRKKILEIFASEERFDRTILSATLRSSCSRLELGLFLWLEAGLCLAGLPAHAVSAALSLALAGFWVFFHFGMRLCGKRIYAMDEEENRLIIQGNMSRLGASFFIVWCASDVLVKLPALAAIFAAVFPLWAAAAALLLSLQVCVGPLRKLLEAEAEPNYAQHTRRWEMTAVLALALSYPLFAPLVLIGIMPIAIYFMFWQDPSSTTVHRDRTKMDARVVPETSESDHPAVENTVHQVECVLNDDSAYCSHPNSPAVPKLEQDSQASQVAILIPAVIELEHQAFESRVDISLASADTAAPLPTPTPVASISGLPTPSPVASISGRRLRPILQPLPRQLSRPSFAS